MVPTARPLVRQSRRFEFVARMQRTDSGVRADDERELAHILEEVALDCVHYHTHGHFLRHGFVGAPSIPGDRPGQDPPHMESGRSAPHRRTKVHGVLSPTGIRLRRADRGSGPCNLPPSPGPAPPRSSSRDEDPGDRPFMVFVVLNVPIIPGIPVQERAWFRDVWKFMQSLGAPTADRPDEFTAIVLTNFSYHFDGARPAGGGEHLCVVSKYPRHQLPEELLGRIMAAVAAYEQIPAKV